MATPSDTTEDELNDTFDAIESMLRLSDLEDSDDLGNIETSRNKRAKAKRNLLPVPDIHQVDEWTKRISINCSGPDVDDYIEKLLECPVCFNLVLPPILSCVSGHSCCNDCRQKLSSCPICRGEFTNVRNLFAEHFLEKCLAKCKNTAAGCEIILPPKKLAIHHEKCDYRPIPCWRCNAYVHFKDYLKHLRKKDKIKRQNGTECSTRFEIGDQDLNNLNGEPRAISKPIWMHCYEENFFCTLETDGKCCWIWISSLTEAGCQFKGQIIVWNQEKGMEVSYTGPIHSIRSDPEQALETDECLIMNDKVFKDFMNQGGIDVVVSIERI